MKYLLKAITLQLRGNPVLREKITNVYLERGPSGDNKLPYVVVQPQGSPQIERTTGDDYIQQRSIIFRVSGIGHIFVMDAVEAIEDEFFTTLPALDSGRVMDVTNVGTDFDIDPERTSAGEDVWHGILNLEFTVQKRSYAHKE